MSIQQISLFPNVAISENLSKEQAIKYLKRHCTVDDLGDTIYVKKLGDNKTTFAIDFNFGKVCVIRKINDKKGNSIEETLFEDCESGDGVCESRCVCDEPSYDETLFEDCESGDGVCESRCVCDEPSYDETESQCIICGGYLD